MPGGTLSRQSAAIVAIVRTGTRDGYGRPDRDLAKEALGQRAGQANAAMRGGMSRPGNRAGMQSHAIPREAEKIGHLGPGEAATRRNLMAAPLGVGDDYPPLGIVNFAVQVRLLLLLLAHDGKMTDRGRVRLEARGDIGPTDLLVPFVKTGLLAIDIHPDVGDLAIVAFPFPALGLGGPSLLGLHGEHGFGGLGLGLGWLLHLGLVLLQQGQAHTADEPKLDRDGRQGGKEGLAPPFSPRKTWAGSLSHSFASSIWPRLQNLASLYKQDGGFDYHFNNATLGSGSRESGAAWGFRLVAGGKSRGT